MNKHTHIPDWVGGSVVARFEEQVARFADNSAVIAPKETLSYRALDAAANQVADTVIATQANRTTIALLLGVGTSQYAAMLGVLKSGNAYVPLDPNQAFPQLNYQWEDASTDVLIADRAHEQSAVELVKGGDAQVLFMDEIRATAGARSVAIHSDPDDLACLTYTSGTTGKPKGVMQTHRLLLHRAWMRNHVVQLGQEDRQAMLYNYIAGASVSNIYGTLLHGATLCLFDARLRGTGKLARWLKDARITLYHSVPTLFRDLCARLSSDDYFPEMRVIRLGGEPVVPEDVRLCQRHFPNAVYVNGMGIGEAGVVCTNAIHPEKPVPSQYVPVGKPVPGKKVLLIGEEGRSIGSGETGEIVIESRYLSPGYWHMETMTESVFERLANGLRRYHTGDLAYWDEDGLLVIKGRKDQQVKVRGQKVDLRWVESLLLEEESVQDAVLILQEEESVGWLAAYLMLYESTSFSVSALRQRLADRLPEHMVPSAIIVVDAFPLTATGKVDRDALPIAMRSRAFISQPFMAPRTSLEEALAQDWSEVLVLEQVGIHDSLFDLGGHSLIATRLLARVRERTGVEIDLARFFEAPTIAALSIAILQKQATVVGVSEMAMLLDELEALPNTKKTSD